MTYADLIWHKRLREKGAAKTGALYIWRQQERWTMKKDNAFRETVVGYCFAGILAAAVALLVFTIIVQLGG